MRALADGKEHSLRELIDTLASQFRLTDQECNDPYQGTHGPYPKGA